MTCSTHTQQDHRPQRSNDGRGPGGHSRPRHWRRAKRKQIARSNPSPIFALRHTHRFTRRSHRDDRIGRRAGDCTVTKANRPAYRAGRLIRRHATRSRRTSGTDLNCPRPITHTFDPDPSLSPVTTRRQLSVSRRRVSAGRRRTISARRRRRTIGIRRRRRAIIVRRRRIISRRRRVVTRRRAVGDSATDNRASGEAAENAGADSAAVTAGICRSRSGQSGKANARSADKRNERLMHKFSP